MSKLTGADKTSAASAFGATHYWDCRKSRKHRTFRNDQN